MDKYTQQGCFVRCHKIHWFAECLKTWNFWLENDPRLLWYLSQLWVMNWASLRSHKGALLVDMMEVDIYIVQVPILGYAGGKAGRGNQQPRGWYWWGAWWNDTSIWPCVQEAQTVTMDKDIMRSAQHFSLNGHIRQKTTTWLAAGQEGAPRKNEKFWETDHSSGC